MIVTVDVPVVAVELAVNVTTLVEVVGFVPKVAVTPAGNPEADRVTLPVKPFRSATEMVLVPVPPCATETLVGDADRLKSAAAAPPDIALIRFWPLGLPQPVTRSYPVTALNDLPWALRLLPLVTSWKSLVKLVLFPMA